MCFNKELPFSRGRSFFVRERKLISKRYVPKEIEDKWYSYWVKNQLFLPRGEGTKFSIAVPPPNVTGILHIGHCLNSSIQDVFIRFKRMDGYNVLWIPGLDHAGISTQQKVLQKLENDGVKDITRDEFLSEAWSWKEKFGDKILSQFRKLGLSLDWSRERFTLDDNYKEAVKEFFRKLYEDNLIYKGEYIVNWSTAYSTALSDDEVDYKDVKRGMWDIAYKVEDTEIIISTTRPETMFGDTAVAVNPEDERYADLIGKHATIPIINRNIPIIADSYVKKDFGTGALKVTPAHDPNDFEIGKRHNLDIINIFDKDFRLNVAYEGLGIEDARKRVLEELKSLGALRGFKEVVSPVGHCSKSGRPIESVVSRQWFVKMKPLAKKALEAVKSGEIEMYPEHWKKIYYHWIENIKDWCISRQLWWGHKIPLEGEEDVLDTWFSSALWPFAILGWPRKTEDLDRYFPTDMVITGGDIIFFWVARMIMSSYYCLDKKPFSKVLFHGIVRDEDGKKMSKSLGNSPDPLDIIEKYGADALRFALIYNNNMGNDLLYSESWVELGRNFCNKLWNTFRFISMNTEEHSYSEPSSNLDMFDKWIIGELNSTISSVRHNIEKGNLDIALKAIFNFFWGEFADWYIEISKLDLKSEKRGVKLDVLVYTLNNCLKLLHPFLPFITEEIYQHLNIEDKESISISAFPSVEIELESYDMNIFKEIVKGIRSVRKDFNIGKDRVTVELKIDIDFREYLEKFTNSQIIVVKNFSESSILKTLENMEIAIVANFDREKEIDRLESELKKETKAFEKVDTKLKDKTFIAKAPDHIVEREQRILEEYSEKIDEITRKLGLLK